MKKQSFIDSLTVKEPCPEKWDEMTGNERVRFCSHCSKSVSDLSAMSRKQALQIVRESGGNLCVRFAKDPVTNRTIFADRLHQISRRAPLMAAGVMTASLGLSSLTYAQGGVSLDAPPAVERLAEQQKECKDGEPPDTTAAERLGSASVSGQVTDANGAVIPAATISLINDQNAEQRNTTSDESGAFRFAKLPAGTYTMKLSAGAFTPLEIKNIAVADGDEIIQTATMDVSMQFVTMGVVAVTTTVEYQNPLSLAAINEDAEELRAMLAGGARVNTREEDGSTPLFAAVESGNTEIVELLLSHGTKINARNKLKETPLMKLDGDSTKELVELLVRHGADVSAKAKNGDTALILAARDAKFAVVKALIDAGADVNAVNNDGQTALINAANQDDVEVVRLLLIAGADPNARNKEGDTAWDLTGETAIEELLVSFGAIVDETEAEPEDLPQ